VDAKQTISNKLSYASALALPAAMFADLPGGCEGIK